MYDIYIVVENRPGALGLLGKTLGQHGVGLEGGGVFTSANTGHAHFLVEDGEKARQVLTAAGYNVKAVSRPLIRKLSQTRRGELGEIAEALGHSGEFYAGTAEISVTSVSARQPAISGSEPQCPCRCLLLPAVPVTATGSLSRNKRSRCRSTARTDY